MDEAGFAGLSENHRRAISATLRQVDEIICEFEQFARGREIHSICYQEQNELSADQKRALLREISKMRNVLGDLKETLGLKVTLESAATRIWGYSNCCWVALVETESKGLRGYGAVPPGFAEYLDPRMETLIKHLQHIIGVVK